MSSEDAVGYRGLLGSLFALFSLQNNPSTTNSTLTHTVPWGQKRAPIGSRVEVGTPRIPCLGVCT